MTSRERLIAFLRAAGPERTEQLLSRMPPQEAQTVRQILEQSPPVQAVVLETALQLAETFVANASHKHA